MKDELPDTKESTNKTAESTQKDKDSPSFSGDQPNGKDSNSAEKVEQSNGNNKAVKESKSVETGKVSDKDSEADRTIDTKETASGGKKTGKEDRPSTIPKESNQHSSLNKDQPLKVKQDKDHEKPGKESGDSKSAEERKRGTAGAGSPSKRTEEFQVDSGPAQQQDSSAGKQNQYM